MEQALVPAIASVCRVPLPLNEAARLASACGACDPDAEPDPAVDALAHEAASRLGAPVGVVTLVLERDQRSIGRFGTDLARILRDESFCARAILCDGPLVVEDARKDPRFRELPVVVRHPFVRFYAGAPYRDADGLPLGTVCVLDVVPRRISPDEVGALEDIARRMEALLEEYRGESRPERPSGQA